MQHEADLGLVDLDLVDEVLKGIDDFPDLEGVISPMSVLCMKYGESRVQEALNFIRAAGLTEGEVNWFVEVNGFSD